jgi:hypothetical protein
MLAQPSKQRYDPYRGGLGKWRGSMVRVGIARLIWSRRNSRLTCHPAVIVYSTRGGNLMLRLVWLIVLLMLSACGGGKSAGTLAVVCSGPGAPQLLGATSIDVLGDVVNGRPTMNYPDPVSPGKTGSISVEPRSQCRITPQPPS